MIYRVFILKNRYSYVYISFNTLCAYKNVICVTDFLLQYELDYVFEFGSIVQR